MNVDFIRNSNMKKMFIGGESSLPSIFDTVKNSERISGRNRNETNAQIIAKYFKNVDKAYSVNDGKHRDDMLIDAMMLATS